MQPYHELTFNQHFASHSDVASSSELAFKGQRGIQ